MRSGKARWTKTALAVFATLMLTVACALFAVQPVAAYADPVQEPPTLSDEGVYLISNAAELQWFAQAVNEGRTSIDGRVVDDIVIQRGVLSDGGLNGTDHVLWTPIGTASSPYMGTFDGQGHTISGIYCNSEQKVYPDKTTPTYAYQGLFGAIAMQGTVRDVSVADSYISAQSRSGAIAGQNLGTIEGCTSSAVVMSDYLVTLNGNNYGYGEFVGGIAGYNGGTVRNCANEGLVGTSDTSGNYRVGGICGQSVGTVSHCTNGGEVHAAGASFVGGIVGIMAASGSKTGACSNYGTVTGIGYLGGIVGSAGSQGVVSNSYNAGTLVSQVQSGAGAISGGGKTPSGYVSNCYLAKTYGWGIVSADDSEELGEGCARKVYSAPEAAWMLNTQGGTAENSGEWAATADCGRLVAAGEGVLAPCRLQLTGTAGNVAGTVYRCTYSDAAGQASLAKADPRENCFEYGGLFADEACTRLLAETDAVSIGLTQDGVAWAKMIWSEAAVHEPYPDEVEEAPAPTELPVHEAYGTDVESFEIHTDHYGEWVMQSDGSAVDLQVAKAALTFAEPIRIADVEALAAELSVKINASRATFYASAEEAEAAVYANPSGYRYVIDGVSEDGRTLNLTVYIGYAIFAGHLFIDPAVEGGITQLVTVADGTPINLACHAIVPNGIYTQTVTATPASADTPARTTVRFVAPQDEGNRTTRAMTHITFLVNGQPVGNYLNSNFCTEETHWHDYQNLTVEEYVRMCYHDGKGWLSERTVTKYFDLAVDGDELTVTAKESDPGDVIEVHVSSYRNDGTLSTDTTALEAAIAKAADAVDAGAPEGREAEYAAFWSAYRLAQASVGSPYYSQADVDAKAEALEAALAALGQQVEPDPVQPDPVQPDPVQPDPVQPDPVQPDPITPKPIKFKDIRYYDDWEAEWVDYVSAYGLMTGYTAGIFGKDDALKRQDAAVVLYRAVYPERTDTRRAADYAKNASGFADVTDNQYYTAAINWAKESGIMTGDGSTGYTTVRPGDLITREELATMLFRYATQVRGASVGSSSAASYASAPDAASVSEWAAKGVGWCFDNHVMTGNGTDGTLVPQGTATRGHMAKMITVVVRDVLGG